MVGKVKTWLGKRPTFLFQQTILSKWDWPRDKSLATIPAVESIISGPSKTVHPARSFLSQIFPPFDKKIVESFMTRFRPQGKGGFLEMSLFDVEGLLGGLGNRRQKRKEPKTIDRKGISIIG